jgi:hypothetical protein
MKTIINNKQFEVKCTNGRYFYFSHRGMRWFPIAKKNVIFEPIGSVEKVVGSIAPIINEQHRPGGINNI